MKYRMLAVTALACGTIGGAALAQQEDTRINVDLVNVQADLAQQLGVDATQVPMTVMAPLDVAAEACGEDAAALAEQNIGTGSSEGSADGSGDVSASGDASGGDGSASGDAGSGDTASGDAAASGGSDSSASVDTDGGEAGSGCIASTPSPLLVQFVQEEMSGASTSP